VSAQKASTVRPQLSLDGHSCCRIAILLPQLLIVFVRVPAAPLHQNTFARSHNPDCVTASHRPPPHRVHPDQNHLISAQSTLQPDLCVLECSVRAGPMRLTAGVMRIAALLHPATAARCSASSQRCQLSRTPHRAGAAWSKLQTFSCVPDPGSVLCQCPLSDAMVNVSHI
jgi:hypothetical protein